MGIINHIFVSNYLLRSIYIYCIAKSYLYLEFFFYAMNKLTDLYSDSITITLIIMDLS